MSIVPSTRLQRILFSRRNAGSVQPDPSPAALPVLSEEHLRFLAESLPEIVWTALPDGTVDYMNRRWFDYTGFTEDETYSDQKTAVHPEDFPLYKSRWQESVKGGQPYEMAYRFRRASDGMYRWHIGRALPVRDAAGRIIKWFGTCVDIQGQKDAEEQILQMNEQLESTVLDRTKNLRKEVRQRRRAEDRHHAHLELLHNMIDLFPMAVVAVDGRGLLLHSNESFRELFGLSENNSLSLPPQYAGLTGLIRRKFPSPEYEQPVRSMLASAVPLQKEFQCVDGRTFLFKFLPMTDGGMESGYLLLLRDISQEKRIDQVKSEFMTLASHQLRTPLTAVRWALSRLSRLLNGRMSDDERRLLYRARSASMAMAQTITTMLSISRMEAGLLTVNVADLALASFFGDIGEEYSGSCEAAVLTLTVDCPDKLLLRTDAVILREIIDNLLTNAIKYTPRGGSIFLGVTEERGSVLFRIRDTGCGIPLHQQKMVFSKFFRGENAAKMDTQGTGLGLYLVSQLVSALGGSITFSSEEGKGTEFVLSLPRISE